MRHKLRLSKYGRGLALVCGIVGGSHRPRAQSLAFGSVDHLIFWERGPDGD